MGHLTEMSLVFVLVVASSAFGLNINTTSGLNVTTSGFPDPGFNVSLAGPDGCPYGWTRTADRCLYYISLRVDWATAEGHCLNMGANLVSVHSESEFQALKGLIRTYDPSENPTWLGLSNCHKRDNWFWSDGSKYQYTRWCTGEPNHSNGECCVHINTCGERNWNDIPCDHSYPFVCARSAE